MPSLGSFYGTYETPPTIGRISGYVETTGETLEAARDTHPAAVAKVRAVLDAQGAKGLVIERSTYRVTETRPYQYDDSPNVTAEMKESVVFESVTSFSLATSNFASIEEVVSAIALSDFVITDTRFGVEDERAPLLEARRKAALDALEQATVYADTLGLELAGIHSVVDGDAQPPDGYADLGIIINADGTIPLSIVVPETIPFHASVDVTWMVELEAP